MVTAWAVCGGACIRPVRSDLPFQVANSGAAPVGFAPTATQLPPVAHETASRLLVLATRRQLPFASAITGFPTARQSMAPDAGWAAAAQDTPVRKLSVGPSGDAWRCQDAPFHRSASECAVGGLLYQLPTAMHCASAHETPSSMEACLPKTPAAEVTLAVPATALAVTAAALAAPAWVAPCAAPEAAAAPPASASAAISNPPRLRYFI